VAILRQGGNAFDAAVAAGFVEAVVALPALVEARSMDSSSSS